MAAFVINDVKESTFYMVMTALCLLSNFVFLFTTKPRDVKKLAAVNPEVTKDLAIGASLKESLKDSTVVAALEPVIELTVKEEVLATLKMMFEWRMFKLWPIFIWTSIGNAAIATVFIPFFTDLMKNTDSCKDWNDDKRDQVCLFAMIGLGFGEIAGSLFYGFIEDKYHSRAAAIACFIMATLAVAVSIEMAL